MPDLDIVNINDRAKTRVPAAQRRSRLASGDENHNSRSRQCGFTPCIARVVPPQSKPNASGNAINIQPAK
jgi:hypothetical protein